MKKKRIIALLLSMAMVCGMLGGCGKESKPSQQKRQRVPMRERRRKARLPLRITAGQRRGSCCRTVTLTPQGCPLSRIKSPFGSHGGRMPWTPGQTQMKNPL